MKRFVMHFRVGIEQAPLQVYCSALFFAPTMSVVRREFKNKIPQWIVRGPEIENWSATIQTLEGHSNDVITLSFSPNDKQLASGSWDRTIRIWDTATGTCLQTFKGHSGHIQTIAFSPNGKQLASGSRDFTIRVWDAATGEIIQILEGHAARVTAIAFSFDGEQLIYSSEDGTIRLWNLTTGETVFLGSHSGEIRSIALSPDGKQLASGSEDATIKLWDITKGSSLKCFKGHSYGVTMIAFSPDSKEMLMLASASQDQTVRIWDAATGATIQVIETGQMIRCIIFSPDGKQLISGADDATVRIWDIINNVAVPAQILSGHILPIYALAISSNNKQLASGSCDRTIRIWDLAIEVTTPTSKNDPVKDSYFVSSPDSKLLAFVVRQRKALHIWDFVTESTIMTSVCFPGMISQMKFSPDSKQLLCSTTDDMFVVLDVATGANIHTLKRADPYVLKLWVDFALSSHSQQLVFATKNNLVKVWSFITQAVTQTFVGHSDTITVVAFLTNNIRIVSGSLDRTVRIWDLATGLIVHTLQGHAAGINSVIFSHDDKQLVSHSFDQTFRIWDIATGENLHILKHGGMTRLLSLPTDTLVMTEQGGLEMIPLQDDTIPSSKFSLTLSQLSIYVLEDWIMYKGKYMLWLPPDNRHYQCLVHENKVCLVDSSENLSVYEFSF
jgi:WD40 repeat protein